MDTGRSALSSLKPSCVRLSELAVQLSNAHVPLPEVAAALEDVAAALEGVRTRGLAIDQKLAEYVFFPLSSIFRERQNVPTRLLERSLQCLGLLLCTGWSSGLDGGLAVQLLIMLTFMVGGTPNASPTAPPPSDELKYEALVCQHLLLTALARSAKPNRAKLLDAANVPALGHAVTVLLDCAKSGPSVDVQIAALDALNSLCTCIGHRPALASFLPGVVSTLTQILTPSTKQSQPYKALVKSLVILTYILGSVLADSVTFPLPKPNGQSVADGPVELGEAWLQATAAQVKMALANVMKVRKHGRREVRVQLRDLCFMLLQDCPQSLKDSNSLALETLFVLAQADGNGTTDVELAQIVLANPEMVEQVRTCLYNWLMSMPRIMLSNDDDAKKKVLGLIANSFKLLSGTEVDLTVINVSLLHCLQDSLLSIAKDTVAGIPAVDQVLLSDASSALALQASTDSQALRFPSVFNFKTAQSESISSMSSLLQTIASSEQSLALAQEALDQARFSTGVMQATNIWLALSLARNHLMQEDILDPAEFLAIDISSSAAAALREDLYSFALDYLNGEPSDDTSAWQVQSLSIEIVCLQAFAQQAAFRPELVDALYPVVHHLGSPNPFLRRHAALSLNSIAQSCNYPSAQALLTDNSDYLVNAIGMKLNAFNVEPQAPQVLRMLARLCGPKIVPYLDDIVDGVFEALDCFHGYPSLVELLFSALGAVVEESAKAEVVRYDNSEVKNVQQPLLPRLRKDPVQKKTVAEVAAKLRSKREKRAKEAEETQKLVEMLPTQAPHKPWAELRSHAQKSALEDDGQENDEESLQRTDDEKPRPLTKPYLTTLRIATSVQNHLTTPAAHTRLSLLRVLLAAIPYLSRHEDSFLPLINSIWPVLVPRLSDPEIYIVCTALEVMGLLVVGSGDFISSRIEALWSEVKRLWALSNPVAESSRRVGDGARGTRVTGSAITSTEMASITSIKSAPKTAPSYKPDTNLTQSHAEPIISISATMSASGTSSNTSQANTTDRFLTPISSRPFTSSTQIMKPIDSSPGSPPAQQSTLIQTNRPAESQQQPNSAASSTAYTPTTTLRLRGALITFCTRVLTHTRITPAILSDIQSWLLPYAAPASSNPGSSTDATEQNALESYRQQRNIDALGQMTARSAEDTTTSPADAYAALRDTNPDLLWLARAEALWRADPAGQQKLWRTRCGGLPTSFALPAGPKGEDMQAAPFEFAEAWAKREAGMGLGEVRWNAFVF